MAGSSFGRDASELFAVCMASVEFVTCNESLPPVTGPWRPIGLRAAGKKPQRSVVKRFI